MNPRDERATTLPRRQRIPIELVIALVGTAAMLALSLAGCNVPAKISGDAGAATDAHHGSGSTPGTDAGTANDAATTPTPSDAPTTPPLLDAAPPPPPPLDAPLPPPPADAAVDAAGDAT